MSSEGLLLWLHLTPSAEIILSAYRTLGWQLLFPRGEKVRLLLSEGSDSLKVLYFIVSNDFKDLPYCFCLE